MLKDTIFNSTNKRTLRLDAKLLRVKGDAFYLIELPDLAKRLPY
jgi:hypothetical protein